MEKSVISNKKGLRVFDDLRAAIAEMESNNEKFYFHPVVDYGLKPTDSVRVKIIKINCNCSHFDANRENFNASLKIRFLCIHTMKKLIELPLHPLTICLLKNRIIHGKERYVLLSESEPIIMGFYSFVKLKWINIYHYNSGREVAIRFSYNIIENKWSYGKQPPEGREIEFKLHQLLKTVLNH